MLQVDDPEDYVIATGVGLTVREFLEISFSHAGLSWEEHVRFDERYLRPAEVNALIGVHRRRRKSLTGSRLSTAASSPASWSMPTSRRLLAPAPIGSTRSPCRAGRPRDRRRAP